MEKKIEDKIEKNVWSYEEGRAGLKNTKVEKVIEKILTIVFGRKWKTSFQDILNSKQKSVEQKSVEQKSAEIKTPEKKPL